MFPAADAAETCGSGTRRPCAVTGGSFGGLILGGRAEVGPVRSFKAFPVLDTRPAHGINFRPYTTWWCVRELSLMATRELEPGNQAIAGGLPADVAARGCGMV